jgi:hypothetical protein
MPPDMYAEVAGKMLMVHPSRQLLGFMRNTREITEKDGKC